MAELAEAIHAVIRFVDHELSTAGRGTCLPAHGLALYGIRADLEQCLEQLNARHTVDHAVVDFDDERELVVLDSLDDPEFPKWPAPVEVLREQPPHQSLE